MNKYKFPRVHIIMSIMCVCLCSACEFTCTCVCDARSVAGCPLQKAVKQHARFKRARVEFPAKSSPRECGSVLIFLRDSSRLPSYYHIVYYMHTTRKPHKSCRTTFVKYTCVRACACSIRFCRVCEYSVYSI